VRNSHSDRGSVLIVTMCVSLALVSVTLLFGHSMLLMYRGTDNDLAGRQAGQAIEGAARYAESLLTNSTSPGAFPDSTSYVGEALSVGEATFWFLGRPLDTTTANAREYGLVDEASKININVAPQNILERLPGMTAEVAAAIVQWRTSGGSSSSANGGVSSQTYVIKQAPFESIEELALVSGMTEAILYGEDTNLNGVLDPNEDDGDKSLPADNADGRLDPGILEYVTVFSSVSKNGTDGKTARLDVTQQDGLEQKLQTILTDSFGQERATKILDTIRPFPAVTSPLALYLRSKERGGNNAMTAEEFDKIAGNLTMSAGPNRLYPSPINVNTASEAVLACIPGLSEKRAAILAARLQRAEQSGLAWVVDAIGDRQIARSVGPYLTGQCFQVTADVAAVGRNGRGYRRTKFIIDNGTGTPRIIYRRNLAGLGWALGEQVRLDLANDNSLR
jgi:DNA uptake protein ComE-like DNA-binding protein